MSAGSSPTHHVALLPTPASPANNPAPSSTYAQAGSGASPVPPAPDCAATARLTCREAVPELGAVMMTVYVPAAAPVSDSVESVVAVVELTKVPLELYTATKTLEPEGEVEIALRLIPAFPFPVREKVKDALCPCTLRLTSSGWLAERDAT
jgi:hypothetical protein